MSKTYSVIKVTATGKEKNYGGGYEDVRDVIPKSYKQDGCFYSNPKTKSFYIVTEQ